MYAAGNNINAKSFIQKQDDTWFHLQTRRDKKSLSPIQILNLFSMIVNLRTARANFVDSEKNCKDSSIFQPFVEFESFKSVKYS